MFEISFFQLAHNSLQGQWPFNSILQRRFNRALSLIRQRVERAISLLKGRWRKLLLLDHLDLELEVYIIVAACVLHNFCLLLDDFDDELDDNDDDPGHHPADGRAVAKQTHLMNTVCP